MVRPPAYSESMNSSDNRMVGELASPGRNRPLADIELPVGRPGRDLCLYPAAMGYDLQEEFDFLGNRAMEPNVFFSGRFLAPAMPRLDERQIRVALIRDTGNGRNRLRLLMPFSVEKPGFAVGPSIVRVWSNPFGPLGTPLVDAEDAAETLDNLLEAMGRRQCGLPPILVFPDIRLNGPFATMLKAIALGRNLPVDTTGQFQRPMLQSFQDGEAYLKHAVSKEHLREMNRQWRQLESLGTLSYTVSRQPSEIRWRMEEFLALEASGWKGAKRTAMIVDRYRAAFAREAITNLAETDAVRIHTLDLDGKAIAAMVVFLMNGEAYTWKTAYNETYSRFSPGKLLVARLTEWHLDDANILRTDSCGVPDHPVMSRLWEEREEMGTLVVGLHQNGDRDVRQASAQLHLYRNTRNVARLLREKIMSLAGR
ncbi:GNAT family N-acetyltransferase [Rhizobium sp. YJ-22]|uniref:GNAT family N-acetyltransferase n=1 Tax=Rhizobium sp. YJ-22 TaxID=3037556 RepID=UPI002412A537|nr:GNAT family N-acetyltransferase [Rhizobium sp. YJ-22]MDG3580349.1 GNAT family N-acetyltransferase [Rhizobium sp. YJ-22]